MRALDHALRTPGVVLIERRNTIGLLSRMYDKNTTATGGFFQNALSVFGLSKSAEEKKERRAQMPQVPWATDKQECSGYTRVGSIAVIDVKGALQPDDYYDFWDDIVLPGYNGIAAGVRAARADVAVSGILLRIDSPGGLVDGCFELCDEIRKGSARNDGKPIYAAARMAYSAAYAIASACDKIICPQTAGVGSIGVIMLHTDISGWLDQMGIKVEAITSAEHKADGYPYFPLSDEARADFQSEVDEIAKIFVACVVEGRGITPEAVQAQQARGYLAQHSDAKRSGLALGLVDEIGSETDAFEALQEATGDEDEPLNPVPALATEPEHNPAAPASRSAKEHTMSLKDTLAAINADTKLTAEQKLEKINAAFAADPAAAAATEAKPAAAVQAAPAVVKPAPAQVDGFAVLDLPEAKGREDLAKNIAKKVADGKMTVDEAKEMLAAAPKASRLGEHMQGRDQNPGNDGHAQKDGGDLAAAVDRLTKTAA